MGRYCGEMRDYIDNKGFVLCPFCKNKTRIKVLDDSILKRFPLFCPKCKRQSIISIEDKKLIKVEPDA